MHIMRKARTVRQDTPMASHDAKVCAPMHKPCAGGVVSGLDAVAANGWYVVVVKKRYELRSHQYLSQPSRLPYPIESYVACQQEMHFYANRTRRMVDRIVIPGKLFVRVDQQHRLDVLRQCPYLSHYMMDPTRITRNGFHDFARVPDCEIRQLRELLAVANTPVEYLESAPKVGDRVQVLGGRFHGLKGQILDLGNSQQVIVTLDTLGSFRFKLSAEDLGLVVG